jgi:hypothetical protein
MSNVYGYFISAAVSKEIREMTIEEEPEMDVPEPTSGGNSDNDSQSGILCGSIHFMELTLFFFYRQ